MIGFIGLGVMGENLIKNFANKGNSIFVYNRTVDKIDQFLQENSGQKIFKANSIEELCQKLPAPRKIFLMVKAGTVVDHVISELRPLLDKGDIIIDGGNSHYTDTIRRRDELMASGIHFIDVGISGGSEGALNGPSMMAGGDHDVFQKIYPILKNVAAQSPTPCIERLGPTGVGHFVKMVHNGIEYGVMQCIAEAVFMIKKVGHLPLQSISELFNSYADGRLNGFLMETTAKVLSFKEGDNYLLDMVMDIASDKGTGRWTSLAAVELGVSVPTISAAMGARFTSRLKAERVELSQVNRHQFNSPNFKDIAQHIEKALYLSILLTFDQGLRLIRAYSEAHELKIQMDKVLSVWRGGCIIRMHLLDDLMAMLENNPKGVMFSSQFHEIIENELESLMKIVAVGSSTGLPMPALSASLQYYLAMQDDISSAQVIQSLRDSFGAHTYQRLDKDGTFHSSWE